MKEYCILQRNLLQKRLIFADSILWYNLTMKNFPNLNAVTRTLNINTTNTKRVHKVGMFMKIIKEDVGNIVTNWRWNIEFIINWAIKDCKYEHAIRRDRVVHICNKKQGKTHLQNDYEISARP